MQSRPSGEGAETRPGVETRPPIKDMANASFAEWMAELPESVRNHLRDVGLTDPETVADCVAPEFLPGPDGRTIQKSVDVVFVEAVAKAVEEVKSGTAAWAKTVKFFRRCFHGSEAPTTIAEAAPLEAKDAQAEEYYELSPDYKKKRLEALNTARKFEVEDARLPSARLWGRYERLKRVNKEYEPLQPEKVQSEEQGKKRPLPSMLAPVQHGALGWRLPPIQEMPPANLEELETWTYIVENTLFLVGWVKDIAALETFHNRFWARVRKNRRPRPGYRGLTVEEYHDAYMVFQNQWRRAAKTHETLDAAILSSLPAEDDELDGRLALAPRLAATPSAYSQAPASSNGQGHTAQQAAARGVPPPVEEGPAKKQRNARNQRGQRRIAELQQELADARNFASKGAGKGGKPGPGVPARHSQQGNQPQGQGAEKHGEQCRANGVSTSSRVTAISAIAAGSGTLD